MPWFMDAHGMATTSNTLDSAPTTLVTELLQLLPLLAWTCLQLTKKKNAVFDVVFPNMSVVTGLMSSSSVACCPGLFDILQASTAPTLSQLKSVPSDFFKRWGIYLLILEKKACHPRIYIGSGTSAMGVTTRMSDYDGRRTLPAGVAAAFREGYTITHKGLLLWAPIPSIQNLPLLRALFILLEAAFCFAFWAVIEQKEGGFYTFGIRSLCSWDIDSPDYTGLCSHNPLVEQLGVDFSLSPQDLEALKESRRLRTNTRTRKSHAKGRATAIANKTYHCDICDQTFAKKEHLDIHLKSKRHLQKASEIPNSKYQNQRARQFANNIKANRFHCAPCNSTFVTQSVLNNHLKSKKHRKQVLLSSSGSSS